MRHRLRVFSVDYVLYSIIGDLLFLTPGTADDHCEKAGCADDLVTPYEFWVF